MSEAERLELIEEAKMLDRRVKSQFGWKPLTNSDMKDFDRWLEIQRLLNE